MLAGMTVTGSAKKQRPMNDVEYRVKAAFLYNFAKFIDWPAAGDGSEVLSLCILGEDPFGKTLDETLHNKAVKGRPIELHRIREPKLVDATGCNLAFISDSEKPRLDEWMDALAGTAALTVSELQDFTTSGGMIRLFFEENRVRFELNAQSADAAGLRVSSELLQLSRLPKCARRGK
jgi:hypothetical protein